MVKALKRSSPLPNLPSITLSTTFPNFETVSTDFLIVSEVFLTGSITLEIFSERLVKFLPNALLTNLFRASDVLFTNPLITSEMLVHSSLASSKSPITIRQVSVQPEPRASFVVSINCEKVLTLVAASPAVLAISAICLASSFEYP